MEMAESIPAPHRHLFQGSREFGGIAMHVRRVGHAAMQAGCAGAGGIPVALVETEEKL